MPSKLRGNLELPLTPREFQALRLRALGYTWNEAANVMGIGRRTLQTHLRNAADRLGVTPGRPWTDSLIAAGWLRIPEERS